MMRGKPSRVSDGAKETFIEQAAAVDTVQLHCLIPADMHRTLRVLAAQEGQYGNESVIEAIEGLLSSGTRKQCYVFLYIRTYVDKCQLRKISSVNPRTMISPDRDSFRLLCYLTTPYICRGESEKESNTQEPSLTRVGKNGVKADQVAAPLAELRQRKLVPSTASVRLIISLWKVRWMYNVSFTRGFAGPAWWRG